MATTTSAGRVTTYNALPPLKHQVKFQPAETTVRRRNEAIQQQQQRQPTLMQFGLERSTPKSSCTDVSDLNDDDDDFPEPRPKKKRRKNGTKGSEKRRNTLTQMDRDFSRRWHKETNVDSQGWEIWEDSEENRPAASAETVKPSMEQALSSSQQEMPQAASDRRNRSDNRRKKSARFKPAHTLKEPALDIKRGQSTPPSSRHSREIPSSQTPPSKHGFPSPGSRKHEQVESPLQERSINIQPPARKRQVADSQPEAMKLLEKVRLSRLANKTNSGMLADVIDEFPADNDALCSIDPRYGDAALPPSQSAVERFSPSVESASMRKQSVKGPVRKRFVEDSQADDIGLDIESIDWQQSNQERCSLRPTSPGDIGRSSQPATYDPALDALDRDAARFGQTQRAEIIGKYDEVEDSETDDDDLDQGCVKARIASDRSGLLRNASESDQPAARITEPTGQPCNPEDGSASDQKKSQSSLARTTLSQASTVVPLPDADTSQPSASSPKQHSRERESAQLSTKPKPMAASHYSTSLSSPSNSFLYQLPDTLSSSPLPKPPCASQDYLRLLGASTTQDQGPGEPSAATQLERAFDFSLPPPPPLSSSRRQTPKT